MVAIFAALIIYFRGIIGPLLLAFILAYALHPLATRLTNATGLNWRMSVNLIYLVLVILLGALFTWTGLAVVQQLQILIRTLQNFLLTLPDIAANLSTQVYYIGPFPINLTQFDLQPLTEQLLATIQPVLGRVGALISTFAASAVITLGWGLFMLVISYFLLADAGRLPYELLRIDIPGYDADIRRLSIELGNIWNAFLRGQLIIFALAVILNFILMSVLGVRIALGIAILAGIAKFVPYLGPLTVMVLAALVAFFQGNNYFGLPPWQFALVVVVAVVVLDQTFDNLVTPRLLGQTLNVHPAAVLVAAIIAFNLIGIIGLILAAPVLATSKLLFRYTLRKMLDLDPWPESDSQTPMVEYPWVRALRSSQEWWQNLRRSK